ncbi:MAG: ArsA family ATPase [Polyangiaceae bacterium]|nr:ArsA family ATPase [Polyangiaceae bacterium]
MEPRRLCHVLDQSRVILCAGCGGVGKTTIAASLALAGARKGRRVLCLTIDPARRLANALGLERMDTEAKEVEPARLTAAGVRVEGRLTVMMLDPKRTFDDLIVRHASSAAMRDRILQNRVYAHLSSRLAGTQEYMAMEKLLALVHDPGYDLIVLDTPPTSNALDFLDAPGRLISTLDSPMARWITDTFAAPRKSRFDVVARGAALALRGVARLTGAGFIEQVAGFLAELNGLFGGFKRRAEAVSAALRRDDFAYVLVTSPEPASIREVLYFAERLAEHGLRRDVFIVNRVHQAPGATPTVSEVDAALARLGGPADHAAGASCPTLAERIARAAIEEDALARRDRENLRVLDELALGPGELCPIRVLVPAFPADVHDIAALAGIADRIC